jgi:anti-anti-sigma factor
MEEEFGLIRDGGGVWSVAGELDIATSPRLLDAISAQAPFDADLRLDMRALRFLDSQGIRALLRLTEIVGEGRSVVLVGPTPEVRRILDLVHLEAAPGIEIEG